MTLRILRVSAFCCLVWFLVGVWLGWVVLAVVILAFTAIGYALVEVNEAAKRRYYREIGG